jgi:hypothetical protein
MGMDRLRLGSGPEKPGYLVKTLIVCFFCKGQVLPVGL